MALGAVLVDRGRVIGTVIETAKVEGSKTKGTTTGNWFRCRYDPGTESESRDAGGTRRTRSATLLVGRRDTTGGLVVIGPKDKIELQDRDGELRMLEVDGAPEEIRKRRTIIGYTVRLRRANRA